MSYIILNIAFSCVSFNTFVSLKMNEIHDDPKILPHICYLLFMLCTANCQLFDMACNVHMSSTAKSKKLMKDDHLTLQKKLQT